MKDYLSTCPGCGGPADNGHDRCLPPSPYYCTKCEEKESSVREEEKNTKEHEQWIADANKVKNDDICFRGQCEQNKEARLKSTIVSIDKSNITSKVEEDVFISVDGEGAPVGVNVSKGKCCSSIISKIAKGLIYVDKQRRWAIRNYHDDLSSRMYYCPFCGSKLE